VRDVVEIYDWRLVELIAKQHQGKTHKYDVWKRCYVKFIQI